MVGFNVKGLSSKISIYIFLCARFKNSNLKFDTYHLHEPIGKAMVRGKTFLFKR